MEVQQFLTGIGLVRYLPQFAGQGIKTMEALHTMEEECMRQNIGMLPGHVRLLQRHLANRPAVDASAPTPTADDGAPVSKSRPPIPKARPPAAKARPPVAKAQAPTRPPAESAGTPVSELLERARADFRAAHAPAAPEAHEAERQAQAAQKEAEAEYLVALQAARLAATAEPVHPGPDDTLAALAQLAEESAQFVATAVSVCGWPQADTRQVAAVVDAAQQAANRAQWAANAAALYGDAPDQELEWSQKMRQAARAAGEAAEQYLTDCAKALTMTGRFHPRLQHLVAPSPGQQP